MEAVYKQFSKLTLVLGITFIMIGCGSTEDNQNPQQVGNPTYPSYNYGPGGGGQPNLYGNNGFPCQGVNSPQIQGGYSDPCQFMQGNPNAIVRYGDRCFYARDLYGMYSQYYGAQPSYCNGFFNSPYSQFQVYAPYQQPTGSFNYNNSTSFSSQWTGMGDYFGTPGYYGRPRNQYYLDFNLWWNNDKKEE